MKHPGHIEIRNNKIVFVYYEPIVLKQTESITIISRNDLERIYEASKRSIDVNNDYSVSKTREYYYLRLKDKSGKLIALVTNIRDNQACEAEVENKVAEITKIL